MTNSNENRDLYYLDELTDYKVAEDYPDVRGWEISDTNGRTVGKVDRLLVSKSAERVVYLDVEVDEAVIEAGHDIYSAKATGIHEFLNKDGDDHLIVPIGLVTLDVENKIIRCGDINYETFAKTTRFSKGSTIDRNYELVVYGTYLPDSAHADKTEENNFYDRKGFSN